MGSPYSRSYFSLPIQESVVDNQVKAISRFIPLLFNKLMVRKGPVPAKPLSVRPITWLVYSILKVAERIPIDFSFYCDLVGLSCFKDSS